jgi:hypothetical protein
MAHQKEKHRVDPTRERQRANGSRLLRRLPAMDGSLRKLSEHLKKPKTAAENSARDLGIENKRIGKICQTTGPLRQRS